MAKKTKTAEELRAEMAKLDAERDAMRKQIRAAVRAEAKEKAAKQAEADRVLADALLVRTRAAFGDAVGDDELLRAVDALFALTGTSDGRTVAQIAVSSLRQQ